MIFIFISYCIGIESLGTIFEIVTTPIEEDLKSSGISIIFIISLFCQTVIIIFFSHDDDRVDVMSMAIGDLITVIGACERIVKCPVPRVSV